MNFKSRILEDISDDITTVEELRAVIIAEKRVTEVSDLFVCEMLLLNLRDVSKRFHDVLTVAEAYNR